MIKTSNKLLLYIWLFIISLLLTGCWDFEDINRRTITLSVGVDKIDNSILYSGENVAPLPTAKSGEKPQLPSLFNVKAYGKDFEDARTYYETTIPFPDFLGAVRVVVFSQNFAKEGIEPYVNRIDHIFGYRKSLPIVISRESPRELFQTNVTNDLSVGFSIEDTLSHLEKEGVALYPKVKDILVDIALGQVGYIIPFISKENNTIVLLGYAVMKDSKLIDIIDIKKSNGLLCILSPKATILQAVPHPGNKNNDISIKTTLKKRRIKISYIDNKINIDIKMDFSTQIQYLHYIEPITDKDIKMLENILADEIKNSITSIIYKSQKEYKSDIFEFASFFRADNPQIFKKINWEKEYPYANLNVEVKVKVVNMNLFDPNAKREY